MAGRMHDKDFAESLEALLEVSDSKSYILNLKQVLAQIKKNEVYQKDPTVTETIISVYYRCKPKTPVRRVLVSYIENLSAEDKIHIRHSLQEHLIQQLNFQHEKSDSLSHLRCQVETISSLMENFPTGEECLTVVGLNVLKFLAEVLSRILKYFSESLSPVQMNEIMHHCLATIQTSNRLLQKFVSMTTNAHSGQDNEQLEDMVTKYLQSDVFILMKGDFLSDCRCGCAMNVALILKLTAADKLPHLLMSVMFSGVIHSCALSWYTLPDWLASSDITKLDVTCLPVVSQLCLIFGLIAKLDLSELMVEIAPEKTMMTSVFLDQLLNFSKKCSDTASKVLLAKTMTLWTSRMCTGLESKVVPSHLYSSLSGEGIIMKDILQYIWTTWDDQIDVIRQNAKNTFENAIKIHISASQTDMKSDVFIVRVTRELLEVSWSNKGKYGSLAAMATILGMSHLLELCPMIGSELIEQLKELTFASQASDLHDKLCQSHQAECVLHSDCEKQKAWLTLWCQPVITALCGDHKLQKSTIIEYILPKLLKTSKTVLPYLIDQLTVTTTPTRSRTCALIICLRRARSLGQLHHPVKSSESGDTTLWYGLVRVDVLKYALTSTDDQVRLDAFALLCENNKTTEPISDLEFDLVRYFLPFNLNNQSPAFRQHLLSYVQKLFQRMKESWQTLVRQTKRKKDEIKYEEAVHHMAAYRNFIHWLEAEMFKSIRFGSAFPRRTTCLLILSLMVDFTEQMSDLSINQLFMSVSRLGQTNMQTLLDCLTDTFEENKMAATKILSACMKHGFGFQSQTEVERLYKSALLLSSSNKPQDCTTAAYLFKYLLQQPDILLVMKSSAPVLTTSMVASDDPVIDRSPTLHLFSVLLDLLKDELSDARKSLTLAAANRPMYPTLHCIRYILSEIDFKSVQTECLPSWRKLIDALIHLCLDLSSVVSPVVQASSPEGNVPLDIIKSLNLNADTNSRSSESDSSDKIVTLMPEFLVVCCWRTIKEVSLVFGLVCQHVPVTGSQHGIITTHQLFMIGGYFKNQLLESIHRGAFELAYAGFVQMCHMLWRSSIQELHQLPSQWLHAILSDVKGNNSTLCATRRSAGIPFYVQALVSTEPTQTGRTCFKSAMTALISLALEPGDSADAQVHSLNILRALFRDTRLGEDVAPYITQGLTAAVLGFKSENWAVRNSSTLLLSALMTRVFGVKRSKDESSISKKNCQTGRAFFHRYPALYQFLLNELTEATQNIDCSERIQLHPSLYPILMVLGRLFPSSLEGTDTNLNLAAFIPFIIKCASSPVYKTRMIAAKALQPLVQKDQLTFVLIQLMNLLPKSSTNQIKQSRLHGILLQIEHLLLMVHNCQSDFLQEQTLQTVASTWMECVWLISRANVCLVTRKSAFDICDLLLSLGSSDDTKMKSLHHTMITSLRQELSQPTDTSQPFVHEFMTTVAHLSLKHPGSQDDYTANSQFTGLDESEMENIILSLLSSSLYEVRLEVLMNLSKWFSCKHTNDEQNSAISQHCYLNPRIVQCGQSRAVFKQLLSMGLHTEWHHGCITMVFETLKNYPAIESLLKLENIKEIFKQLLQRLYNEQRSEVKSSIIEFSSVMLSEVYAHLTQEKGSELYGSVAEWCRCIKTCSRSDQSEQLQMSCVRAVHDNAVLLLTDPCNVLGCLTFDVWEVVMSLLQEDDLEVKDITSSILPVLDGGSLLADVQPTLALKLLLAKMVQIHGSRDKAGCIRTLVAWIQNSDSVCQDQEERLFDRGEINTYREDVLFVQLVTEQLVRLIHHTPSKSDSDATQTNNTVKTADHVLHSTEDPGHITDKGNTTDETALNHCMSSEDTSQTNNKEKTADHVLHSTEDPGHITDKGNTTDETALNHCMSSEDTSQTNNKEKTADHVLHSTEDPGHITDKGNTTDETALNHCMSSEDTSQTNNKEKTADHVLHSTEDPGHITDKGNTTDETALNHCMSSEDTSQTNNKEKTADHVLHSTEDPGHITDKGNTTDETALNHCMSSEDTSQTNNKEKTADHVLHSTEDPGHITDKGNTTDETALNHCMSSEDTSQTNNKDKTADHVLHSTEDPGHITDKGNTTDETALNHCMSSEDTSQTNNKEKIADDFLNSEEHGGHITDKENITEEAALNHSMSSGDPSQTNKSELMDQESLNDCSTSLEDSQLESLFSGLLEYFCVKLKDMEVVTPVSLFKDCVVYEASVKTLQITASVVKCMKQISNTDRLRALCDELQLVLNSRCQPSHVFLDGCL